MSRLLCTLHLVRHGETTANREGIIQGHQDYDLTAVGENQAAATASRLRGHRYWQTHSSDLKRAYRTAEIILEEHPGSTLSKTSLLREFGLGAQEGLPRGTTWVRARDIKAKEAGVSFEDYEECLRESPADVQKRAQLFLGALVADAVRAAAAGTAAAGAAAAAGERGNAATAAAAAATGAAAQQDENARLALVVAHGGLLNVMMLAVMGLEESAPIMSNCAVAVVDVFEQAGRVRYEPRTLNDVSHFGESGLPASSNNAVENFGHRISK